MQLEFLNDISDGGKHPDVVSNQLIRLFDYDASEATQLKEAINNVVIEKKEALNLASLSFIVPVNCSLTMYLAESSIGITTRDQKAFTCALTVADYITMLELMEPFCGDGGEGHQWLYDTHSPIDFLFSPSGSW